MNITEGKCNGCHSCFNICSNSAIVMKRDSEGFLYPHIDEDKCTNCGLCKKVCPLNDDIEANDEITLAYMAYNKNNDKRKNSSSGGIFVMLAEWIISQKGVVYGAAYDENFRVCHTRVVEDIALLQTSKYVQSEIGECLKQVREDLKTRLVLFSGTPCQIAGLKKYIQLTKAKVENLIAVDIICHGVPSPLVWESYFKKVCDTKIPLKVNFRDKSISWRKFSLAIDYENNERYCKAISEDLFMCGFMNNLFLRPSCYECACKGVERYSDITLGDYWGIESIKNSQEFDDGVSAVIIHTLKGKHIFENVCTGAYFEETDIGQIAKYNSALILSVEENIDRKEFFKNFGKDNQSVINILKKIYEPSLLRRIKRKILSGFQ